MSGWVVYNGLVVLVRHLPPFLKVNTAPNTHLNYPTMQTAFASPILFGYPCTNILVERVEDQAYLLLGGGGTLKDELLATSRATSSRRRQSRFMLKFLEKNECHVDVFCRSYFGCCLAAFLTLFC